MSAAPVFYTTPRTTGNTANWTGASAGRQLTAPTNLVAVVTGATTGTRINRVTVIANNDVATPTATNVIRFFAYDGTTYRLVHEHNVTSAAAASVAIAGYKAIVADLAGLLLPSNTHILYAGIGTWASAVDNYTITAEVSDA